MPYRLDLKTPMQLAARAVAARLDPAQNGRPWSLVRGRNGILAEPVHSQWDFGDMGGRYLESLIAARRMGIEDAELTRAEETLRTFLFGLIADDGVIHNPDTGERDHPFAQGSALYGLLAWFKDSQSAVVRAAIEELISGLLRTCVRQDDYLAQPPAKLPQSGGSHLAGYQIWPVICFYEMTGYSDALKLAEGLTRWVMNDPVLSPKGEITLASSSEGHMQSWLDTLAGCVRTARHVESLRSQGTIEGCRAVYDWVMRTNATRFGWIATFPGHGLCETCAISAAIRLALELVASGHSQYLDDVERFIRNHVVESQFRAPPLSGCFASGSGPNEHLDAWREGESNVEGCCTNGGMRAISLAWDSAHASKPDGIWINLLFTKSSDAAEVIDHQPHEGRVEITPRFTTGLRVRIPPWLTPHDAKITVSGQPVAWHADGGYFAIGLVPAGATALIEFPVAQSDETVSVGGNRYDLHWAGDTAVSVAPAGKNKPMYQGRMALE
jgi:hypothetical protein